MTPYRPFAVFMDYNKPHTWINPALHTPPSEVDIAAFQRDINKIFPLTTEGFADVRLVWAPSIETCYSRRYSDWSKISNLGTASDLRARYKYAEIKLDSGELFDIPPPRWIVEERNSLGQVGESWEQTRFAKDGREMFPPLPAYGYYSELFKINSHDDQCCKSTPKELVCWGKYREPGKVDIDRLKRAKFLRDKDVEINLNAPLNDKVLASAAREANARIALKKLQIDERVKEFVDENALELIEHFTGIKLSEKTKKFSIPKHFKKENGIIVPT